jgi:hypothetical protein
MVYPDEIPIKGKELKTTLSTASLASADDEVEHGEFLTCISIILMWTLT